MLQAKEIAMRSTLACLVLVLLACASSPDAAPVRTRPGIAMAAPISDPFAGGSPAPASSLPGQDINLTPSGGFGFGTEDDLTVKLSNFIAPDLVLGAGGDGRRAGEEWASEGYDDVIERKFVDPFREPISTFSVDVDTASMSNIRRILGEGRVPPAGAVRIEEMLNYFSYEYAGPEGDDPLSVRIEIAECPWKPRHRLVHLGIQARRAEPGPTMPRNLVFLLDVSGSMDQTGKLPLVVSAMRLLVDQLGPDDHVGIITYSDESRVVLEPTRGDSHQTIHAALEGLETGGSTNAGAGIREAYELARRHYVSDGINRVILATDGDFNVGVTNRSDLVRLIESEREDGVFLTVLGVGVGNLKDSQLDLLAGRGNGTYAYLDSLAEARKVLVEEAGGTLVTVAKDVKIQVEWNPRRVGSYRLIGYENRALNSEDFDDDQKDAGDIGTGHSVTALYEITPVSERPDRGEPLKYQHPPVQSPTAFEDEVLTVKVRYKAPAGRESQCRSMVARDPGAVSTTAATDDFRFSAAVAAFGLLLRDSHFKGQASFALVRELAHGSLGEDRCGHRRAFLDLVQGLENGVDSADGDRADPGTDDGGLKNLGRFQGAARGASGR
ncbi:MAG: VWA domain-containing protein [Planctomycetota bacterium]